MPKYSTLLQKNLRAKTGEKVVRGHTLRFKNVFRSSGRKPQQYPQVGNVINFFSGEESPNGPVTSVERREKALKDARASQRANAGILTDKELRAKQLLKIKKKQEEAKQLAAERGIMMKILRTTYNDGRNPYYIEKWDKNKEGLYEQVDEKKGLVHPTDKTPIEDMWRLISKYISKDDQIKRNYVKKEAERVVQKLEEQNQEFNSDAYRAIEFNQDLPNEQAFYQINDPNLPRFDPITQRPSETVAPLDDDTNDDPFAPRDDDDANDDPFAPKVDPFAETHDPLAELRRQREEAQKKKEQLYAFYVTRSLEDNQKSLESFEEKLKLLDRKEKKSKKDKANIPKMREKIKALRKVIGNQEVAKQLKDLDDETDEDFEDDVKSSLEETKKELDLELKKPKDEQNQNRIDDLKINILIDEQLLKNKSTSSTSSAKGIIGGRLIPKITPNRVKRLFEMKSPLTIQPRMEAPVEEVENDLNELKQRQRMYSERMKTLRGKAPPKGMVERAFPSGVTPLELEPNRDITPYAFLPPKKAPRLHLYYI